MTWLLWRQHRLQAALAAATLLAFAIPVWITGRHLADGLRGCRAAGGCGAADLFRGYQPIISIVILTMLVPLLVGVFWGTTLIGKELESGTAALVWTQSTTRRRWLRDKLLALFGATLLFSGAVTALVTWWSDTRNSLVESRFVGVQFDIQGVAPVGFALFAAALGLASGALWRRVLPAMATTVAGFVAVRLLVELAWRPHYLAPLTATQSLKGDPRGPGNGSWEFGTDLVWHGRVINGPIPAGGQCAGSGSRDAMSACMDRLGYQLRTTYQPAGRWWTFQWIEFGIFTGLAAVLVVTAVLVLRRRDA